MVISKRVKVIDELGKLYFKLAPFRKLMKREDELRKEVRTWAVLDGLEPADAQTYASEKFFLVLGPRSDDRTVLAHNQSGSRTLTVAKLAASTKKKAA